ncbi:coiled-coil domain-containing protein 106-like [Rhinichthys klamathensis goyatoka]|uniref:coiled-coil domain-containing protein 106-like n=1 Tax=Rhinichthys klamathensis goyatoka TaxID=3034132 RepID=UPI0024B58828|nr:coiled-coil domain-containing protein 106-like [Rhinichthys klamathensis goyatoka]
MQGASSKMRNMIVNPDSSDEVDNLNEKKGKRRARKEKKKKSNKVDSSSSSNESVSYSTSDSSVSSSPHKSRKHKKKSKKAGQKMQKSRRVFLPEHAIQRYKKVLQYLQQGITKTLAYHKCGVDRKTIVDTAAIAELEACDGEAYKTLRETFHRGQKLSQFAEQCKEMCMKEPLQSVIEQKKKNGLLIDLCQKQK